MLIRMAKAQCQVKKRSLPSACCYPLSPKRDQCPFSPNNIDTSLREKVTRIHKMITKAVLYKSPVDAGA